MENKKWKNPQAYIILLIILTLFLYMGVDFLKVTPVIKSDIDSVKIEYRNLSKFLDHKIPEIDSALKIQAVQITDQTKDIDSLKSTISKATGR
jgi:hypothetical protein